MSIFVDQDYINQISSSLPLFKWVRPGNLANCRCVLCGDSKTNNRKARGYFFRFKDMFVYKCHACSASMSFMKFLKLVAPSYYPEYKLEKFRDSVKLVVPTKKEPMDDPTLDDHDLPDDEYEDPDDYEDEDFGEFDDPEGGYGEDESSTPAMTTISSLPDTHEARLYVAGRKIPESRWDDIGYTENFAEWVLVTSGMDKYKKLPRDKRILFELRDRDGKLFGIQGRSLDKDATLRYITLKFDDDMPKVFGLDSINTDSPIYVTEGPIDSLFLPNALAICGGDVSMSLRDIPVDKVTIVLDNEPRSSHMVSRMTTAIKLGYGVCFWKIDAKYKDINDMVTSGGLTKEEVLDHIIKNSYRGARAMASLTLWKKTKGYK